MWVYTVLYIALKHVIRRFRICSYFHEIFKFRDFINALKFSRNILLSIKSRKLNISYIMLNFCNIFRD